MFVDRVLLVVVVVVGLCMFFNYNSSKSNLDHPFYLLMVFSVLEWILPLVHYQINVTAY